MISRLRLSLVLTVAFLFAAPVAAQAIDLVRYPAKIDVEGKVTITSQYGELKNCLPAQRYTIQEIADVDISGKLTLETYGNKQLLTVKGAKTPRGATSKNVLSDYAESNYCPPDDDPIELDKPNCRTYTGTGTASLLPDYRLKTRLVAVGFSRITGGSQAINCMSLGVNRPSPLGTDVNNLDSEFASIVLPLGVKIIAFNRLRKGKKIQKTIRISGPCDKTVAGPGAKPKKLGESQNSCDVSGSFKVRVKRLR